jgi:hypothetical protein
MRRIFQLAALFALVAVLTPTVDARADDGGGQVLAEIVRALGYGGGIHHFKNFVLREKPEYHTAAKRDFGRALEALARLETSAELDDREREHVAVIRSVVESYDAEVDRINGLRLKGWRIEDVDRTVIIDDTPATAGLAALRAKWQWSDLEEIEFQVGYGNAIHNFKNYILRGQERYHTAALANLLAVDALVARQLHMPELARPRAAAEAAVAAAGKVDPSDAVAHEQAVQAIARRLRSDRAALEAVERVFRGYRNNLALVSKLIAMQRSASEIDRAIRIYDKPGMDGLAHLRQAGPHLLRPASGELGD